MADSDTARPPSRMPAAREPWLVLGFALAVRLLVLLDAGDAPFWAVPMVDEVSHLRLAESIANQQPPAHGAFYAAPGYAYYLAAVLQAGGDVTEAKLIQLLLGAVNAMLVAWITRRFFPGWPALVAGAVWAVYPGALLHELLLLKPTWTVFFCLLALALVSADRPVRSGRWALAGASLGAAALFRGEMVGVACALLAVGTWRRWRRDEPVPARGLGLAAVGLAAVVAIPTFQNLNHGGGFVPIAYGGGTNFYIGNHAGADGSYLPLRPDRSDALVEESDAVQLATEAEGKPLTPAQVSRYWWRQGLSWWLQDPMAAVALTLKKALLVWGWWEGADVLSRDIGARWVMALRNPVLRGGVLLPVALIGLWVHRGRGGLWPLATFLVASQVALTFFFLFERFRLPLTAVSLVYVAGALAAAAQTWRVGPRQKVLLAGAGTVALALVLAIPRVDRNPAVLRVNVGSMLMQQGRFEEALEEFTIVRREAPRARRVEINIATALSQLGRDQQALRSLLAALQFLYAEAERTGRPAVEEIVYCHQLAGDIQRRLGQMELARQQYQAALRFSPQNPQILQRLRAMGGG